MIYSNSDTHLECSFKSKMCMNMWDILIATFLKGSQENVHKLKLFSAAPSASAVINNLDTDKTVMTCQSMGPI